MYEMLNIFLGCCAKTIPLLGIQLRMCCFDSKICVCLFLRFWLVCPSDGGDPVLLTCSVKKYQTGIKIV